MEVTQLIGIKALQSFDIFLTIGDDPYTPFVIWGKIPIWLASQSAHELDWLCCELAIYQVPAPINQSFVQLRLRRAIFQIVHCCLKAP